MPAANRTTNRLPTADELRQAAALLGVPKDQLVATGEGTPRDTTRLLAVLDAWLTAYQSFHAQYVDEGPDHQAQARIVATAEVDANSGGVPTSLMSSAIWRLRVAMATVAALSPSEADDDAGRVDPAHPGVCLVALCQAAAMILDDWREANSASTGAVDYGGRRYGITTGQYGPVVRQLVTSALEAIDGMSAAQANIDYSGTPIAWMPNADLSPDWIENIHYPRWPIPDTK